MSTPTGTPTNGGVRYSFTLAAPLEPQLARILAAHDTAFGWVPAVIYLVAVPPLTYFIYQGHVVPLVSTGRGWPGPNYLALSDTAPKAKEDAA